MSDVSTIHNKKMQVLKALTKNQKVNNRLLQPVAIVLSIAFVFIGCVWSFNFIRLSLVFNNATQRIANGADATIDTVADVAHTVATTSLWKDIWVAYKELVVEPDGNSTSVITGVEPYSPTNMYIIYSVASVLALATGVFVHYLMQSVLPDNQGRSKSNDSNFLFGRCTCEPGTCKNCKCAKSGSRCSTRCHCKAVCNNIYNNSTTTDINNVTTITTKDLVDRITNMPSISLFVGPPKKGKSSAIKALMYEFNERKFFHFGLVMCASSYDGDYEYLGTDNVWSEYKEDEFQSYLVNLRQLHQQKKLEKNFIIFDDMLALLPLNESWFKNFISQFRKTNTWVFLTAQNISQGSSTLLRNCTDIAFLFHTNNKREMQHCWDNFAGALDKKVFPFVFKKVTEQKHHALVCFKDGDFKDFVAIEAPANFAYQYLLPEFYQKVMQLNDSEADDSSNSDSKDDNGYDDDDDDDQDDDDAGGDVNVTPNNKKIQNVKSQQALTQEQREGIDERDRKVAEELVSSALTRSRSKRLLQSNVKSS